MNKDYQRDMDKVLDEVRKSYPRICLSADMYENDLKLPS